MHMTLKVWRQAGPDAQGAIETYDVPDISDEMSFLEMLDVVNERLNAEGREPIAFEHDCREGICGSCGMMINGQAHGPERGTADLPAPHAEVQGRRRDRHRAVAGQGLPGAPRPGRGPLAFDAIVESGGYITAQTGSAPEANLTPIPKEVADAAMDAAACIGCGACVAACPNSAGQLFTSAKLGHLNLLPQGQAERYQRTDAMVDTMEEFFGSCTNHGECQEACPKEISIDFIAYMNRDYVKAQLKNRKLLSQG